MSDRSSIPDAKALRSRESVVARADGEASSAAARLPYEKPTFARRHVHDVTLLTGGGSPNSTGTVVQV